MHLPQSVVVILTLFFGGLVCYQFSKALGVILMASGETSAPKLTVAVQDYADCRVVSVSGRIDHTNSEQFLDDLAALAGDVQASGGMVIDLSKLEFITSAGLRALLMADRQVKGIGGKLVVAGIGGVVKEVFRISKFDALLSVVDDAAQGVAQTSPAAADLFPG